MSEQERDKVAQNDETKGDDVEAHRIHGRDAIDEGGTDDDAGDDVEAHKLGGKDV
jgi:hypothetical protein